MMSLPDLTETVTAEERVVYENDGTHVPSFFTQHSRHAIEINERSPNIGDWMSCAISS